MALIMKIAYLVCCGADIHKNSIVTTIVTTDKHGISQYQQKTFSTINSDILHFHDWLIEHHCYHVCMESTGKYWILIFNYLEHDIHVCLTHPNYVKAIKVYNIETDQTKTLELSHSHLEYLKNMITQTEIELYIHIKLYYKFVEFVSTMPGMTGLSSTIILAETGINIDIFDDTKHLCSWCGLSPANNKSVSKKKFVWFLKADDYLKPIMVQCDLTAIKSKKDPYFANKYRRLKQRRGHKKTIIAIARMMMYIYHMVSERKPFNPTDYMEMVEPCSVPPKVVLNDKNIFVYLEAQDYDSVSL